MEEFMGLITFILFALGFVVLISIRQINEYQRGVKFTLGKFSKVMEPGWRLVIPIFQSMVKVDMRMKAVDVPSQEAITKDNVSVSINAVIYYKVGDASKAILEVENFYYAVSQLAQTTMRNAVGSVTLDHLLQNREEISAGIRVVIDEASDPWGIKVNNVELKDVVLPEGMKRTMGKEAEAEREKRAVIINSQGELEASENLAAAAKMLSGAPGALHLRTLHAINDISSDESNTTVWMVPIEALKALEAIAGSKK
ncbi:MAG: SPFH domain / Band 7 family protein [Candidatus Peregrinibacteria bacterium GW2011_GWA2_44_7]|nr:MAG: SPFH domain / Band 7 family protein [Candidatus Peregrinibacteria bacterium GW2011_GWA2_44_7]